jgi:hypothetical protein
MLLAGCSYTPAGRERGHALDALSRIENVQQAKVGCAGAFFAGDSLCAGLILKSGQTLSFERVGFGSFVPSATAIVVSEAHGIEPRIASCTTVGPPNFHGDGALGGHFKPPLLTVTEAVERVADVIEEVEFWPRCPMSWDVQDRRGVNYRYCARKKSETTEPPRPTGCS